MKRMIFFLLTIGFTFGIANATYLDKDSDEIKNAIDYLIDNQNDDGGFPDAVDGGSSIEQTCRTTYAILATGRDPNDITKDGNSPIDYLKVNVNSINSSDKLALSIALLQDMGLDPKDIEGIDLVQELLGLQLIDGTFNDSTGSQTAVIVWAIIAFAKVDEQVGMNKAISALLTGAQNNTWGWSVNPNTFFNTPEPDSTAFAIFALLSTNYTQENQVIKDAFNFIRDNQNADGGWQSPWGTASDADTTNSVIIAIKAANIDIANFTKNGNTPIDFLKSLQNPDGSFNWTTTSAGGMAVKTTSVSIIAVTGNTYNTLESKSSGICGPTILLGLILTPAGILAKKIKKK